MSRRINGEAPTSIFEAAQARINHLKPLPPWLHAQNTPRSAGVVGDLPQIIANEERLYEGDLVVYFRVLFFKADNLNHPYHNFRHMMHVLWLCHLACGTTVTSFHLVKCVSC